MLHAANAISRISRPGSVPGSPLIRPVHTSIPGRARFKVGPLYRSEDVKHRLELGLSTVDGVSRIQANILTGSLLIIFERRKSVQEVAQHIAVELGTEPPPEAMAMEVQGLSKKAPDKKLASTAELVYLKPASLRTTALPVALLGASPLVRMPISFLRNFSRGLFHTSPILLLLGSLIVLMGQIVGSKEGWSRTDALYFSFVTASTVGYGDLRPSTRSTKFLSIAIGTVGLLLTGVVTAIGVHSTQKAFAGRP